MISGTGSDKVKLFSGKSSVFYRYLISYIIIFLIPLLSIGAFVYSYFINIYQNAIIDNAMDKLSQAKIVVDLQLRQIKNISDQVLTDPDLLPFNFSSDPMAGMTANAELKKFNSSDSLISEIVFYTRTDQYLFSSNSSYTVDRFFDIYRYSGWDAESFVRDMDTITSPTVRPSEKVLFSTGTTSSETALTTFIYPDVNFTTDKKRNVLILVKSNSFRNLLQNTSLTYAANTIILDADNHYIASTRNDPSMPQLIGQVPKKDTVSKTLTVDHKQYLYLFLQSSDTGWKYITVIDLNSALQPVKNVRLAFVIGSSVVFILGLLVIVWLVNLNYRPIKKLRDYTDTHVANHPKARYNEFDGIQHAIEDLQSENQQLTGQLQNNASALKEYLLYHLLKGQIASVSEFNEKGEKIGLKFDRKNFCIAVFYCSAWKGLPSDRLAELSSSMENALPQGVQGYVREQAELNFLVLIGCYDDEQENVFGAFIASGKSVLKNALQTSVSVGISTSSPAIDAIPKLYMEATTALDYRFLKGIDKVIYYQELTYNQSILDKSLKNIPEKLASLIRHGETEQIGFFLENITHYMRSNNVSIFLARMVCYDIIHSVIKAMDELNVEYCTAIPEYPNVFLISSFETVDELIAVVIKASQDIKAYLMDAKEKKEVQLIDRMILYIKDHYCDSDFSVQQMGDYFGMSASNLSGYFKEHAGNTVLDYVTSLKIAKAKDLLENTGLPLKDVSIEVGYYNITSFIRRFKQLTGMTPGEYKTIRHQGGLPS